MKQPIHENRASTHVQPSKRERILNRVFKMAKHNGHYKQDQFHAFCQYAKGKPESQLVREMGASA